ncbi:MAG: hypothetical protein R3337_10125 [Gammaproteobacteria bacterium]|nr:hypothetical protein [Gammaproteobacteria bacterium]
MRAKPLEFPKSIPAGYPPLADDPLFDPGRHLALETPERIWSLEELGYGSDVIARVPSPMAFTAPFRLLTHEGAEVLLQVVRGLKRFTQQAADLEEYEGNRNQTYLAGGVYRSRFLRDLCNSPEVAEFLSRIAATPIAPHSLPSQQLYINYAPKNPEDHVDIWHADSIDFDYVLMASDPETLKGGEFEVFLGTRAEAASFAGFEDGHLNRGIGDVIPDDRIVSFRFPKKGFAIFQQGHFVIHRAKKLLEPGERMTLVPGYVSLDLSYPDSVDLVHIATYGEPGIRGEVLRHGAWRAKEKLEALVANMDLNGNTNTQRDAMRAVILELERAIDAVAGRTERA